MTHGWVPRLGRALFVLTAAVALTALPAAAQDKTDKSEKSDRAEKPDTTVKGRVQSLDGDKNEKIVLKTDDGRTVTVTTKDISAETRNLVQVGEPIIVTGPLTGDEMAARSVTVAATVPGARLLSGQPPFTGDGAASPPTDVEKKKR